MGKCFKVISACAILAVAACNNANRFDNNDVNLNAPAVDPNAALAAAPGSVEYFQQTVGDRVFFEVDQSVLTTEARLVLDGQAVWLNTNSDFQAVIEGHADEQGTREYNLALGARRSAAVRDYLVSKGLSPSRLRVVSFGKERPIEICSDEACYSKNRRAVTVIAGGLTG